MGFCGRKALVRFGGSLDCAPVQTGARWTHWWRRSARDDINCGAVDILSIECLWLRLRCLLWGGFEMSPWLRRLAVLLRRERYGGELDEEMAFHREQAEKEFVAGGMTPEEARFAAMRQFGNATRMRERSHEVMSLRVETVAQDLRFAMRQLRKNSGFATTAILMLALGIGAST